MSDGLILFAHGARDPRWSAPFEAVAAQVRAQRPGLAVRLAFLEFMSPSLPEAAEALHAQGCRRLCVLPMFLGVGGHVRKDLPALLETIAQAHPDLVVHLSPAIGERDDVVQAMASAALRQADGSLA